MTTTARVVYLPNVAEVAATPTEHARTFHVDGIVDQERDGTVNHVVQVSLTPVQWRMLVGDFARAVQRARERMLPVTSQMAAAGVASNDLDRQDALTELMAILGMPAPAWLLSPEEALVVALQLDDGAAEPPTHPCGCVQVDDAKSCGWHR